MVGSLPRTLLVIGVLLVAVFTHAYADDPGSRAARKHYERGQKLFALQRFDDALEQYQKAYDADPLPAFLFNIAQCHRNLGDFEAAIFSFKRFLKLDPEAENREQVEQLIEDLEEKLAEANSERLKLGRRKKQPEPDPEGDPERSGGSPVYKKWWFWTGISVVAVGAGVGIYLATRPSGPPSTDLGHIDYPK